MTPEAAREHRRSLAALEAIYRDQGRLFLVHLDLTWRCPMACLHCFQGASQDPSGEIPGTDWVAFLEEARKLQVVRVVISGGEPSLHPDFLEVVEACDRLRFALLLKTTGWRIQRHIERLARIPFLSVDVSLHSLDPTEHDAFTGRPGSHEVAVAAIEDLVRRGIPVRVTRSLVEGIRDDGGALRRWCDERGIRLSESLMTLPVRGPGDGTDTPSSRGRRAVALPDEDQIRVLRRLHPDLRAVPPAPVPRGFLCAAGITRLYVEPSGRISPCVAWPRPLGHLREGLGAVLRGEAIQDVRRLRQGHRRACLECSDLALCDFCPGLAETLQGDPTRPYPAACRKARLLRKLRDERGEDRS